MSQDFDTLYVRTKPLFLPCATGPTISLLRAPSRARVPFEIWRLIFLECQASVGPAAAFKVAVVLSSVCQSWRSISLLIVHLWSTLHIDLTLEQVYHQRITLQLARAPHSALDITLLGTFRASVSDMEIHHLVCALSLLLQHKSRWRTFTASTSFFSTLNTLFGELGGHSLQEMKNLRYLHLSAQHMDLDRVDDGNMEHTPALRSLQLSMYASKLFTPLLRVSCGDLRELTLKTHSTTSNDVTAHSLLAELCYTNRLERLTIHGKLPCQVLPPSRNVPHIDNSHPPQYYTLSSLRHLTFIRTQGIDIYAFLELVAAPELQQLTVGLLFMCNSHFYRALRTLQDSTRFPAIYAIHLPDISYGRYNRALATRLLRAIPFCTHLSISGNRSNLLPVFLLQELVFGDKFPDRDEASFDDDDDDDIYVGSDDDEVFASINDDSGDDDDDDDDDVEYDKDALAESLDAPSSPIPESATDMPRVFCPRLAVLKVRTEAMTGWSICAPRDIVATRGNAIRELDIACVYPLSTANAVWFAQHVPKFRSRQLQA